MEAGEVRPQHPRRQLFPPGVDAEHLVGGERRVEEEADAQRRPFGLEHRGDEHELVVVDPDQVAVGGVVQHLGGEPPVHLAVRVPPRGVVAEPAGQVVQQRPEAGVGEALVVACRLFLRHEHGGAGEVAGEGLLDFGAAVVGHVGAGPADPPGGVGVGGDAFERGDEPAGRFPDGVAEGDGEAVGEVEEGAGHSWPADGRVSAVTPDGGRIGQGEESRRSYGGVTL